MYNMRRSGVRTCTGLKFPSLVQLETQLVKKAIYRVLAGKHAGPPNDASILDDLQ